MSKTAIVTDKAPKALGPYSAGVVSNGSINVSGQLGIDPATGKLAGDDIQSQTRQSLTNVKNILETTVLLADINEFGAMNEIYAEFFEAPYPARAAFQVAALPGGGKVEIKAVARV